MVYVSFTGTLLRRANSEDFLEDEDFVANPVWSRADGMIHNGQCSVVTAFLFSPIARENDALHFVSPSTSEKRILISNSDLHNLVQIEEGNYHLFQMGRNYVQYCRSVWSSIQGNFEPNFHCGCSCQTNRKVLKQEN